MAETILNWHRDHPVRPTYAIRLLGSMFRAADLDRLDRGYAELVEGGLMTASGEVDFFGRPTRLYRLAMAGPVEAILR